jgi:hypothetical protein
MTLHRHICEPKKACSSNARTPLYLEEQSEEAHSIQNAEFINEEDVVTERLEPTPAGSYSSVSFEDLLTKVANKYSRKANDCTVRRGCREKEYIWGNTMAKQLLACFFANGSLLVAGGLMAVGHHKYSSSPNNMCISNETLGIFQISIGIFVTAHHSRFLRYFPYRSGRRNISAAEISLT